MYQGELYNTTAFGKLGASGIYTRATRFLARYGTACFIYFENDFFVLHADLNCKRKGKNLAVP